MKTKLALLASLALLPATGCRTTAGEPSTLREGGGRPVGEFVGGPAIQQVVWENLLDQSAPGSKTFRISRVLGDGVYFQRSLLGGNAEDGDRFEYRGGVPNPLGVLLWYKTMNVMAQSIAALCTGEPDARTLSFARTTDKPVLRADVHALVRRLCAAPATAQDLEEAWRHVVGFGIDAEKMAFVQAFGPETADAFATGQERVEVIMISLLMNPSLLLQQ